MGLRIGGGGGAGDVGSGGGRPSAIDLESLRDSGETHASELTIRREKFAHFEKHCTRVAPSVFVAGEAVARDLATLREHGITHIINCNAFVIPNHFENVLTYKSLWLQDSPGEDVTRVLYDCFDFIRAARAAGGNALVHCSQGVSRSVSVAVSFLMWESGLSYEEAFAQVKSQRGIANPNMGFTCQMLQWRKRVAAEAAWGRRPPDVSDPLSVPRTRVYRLAPHSEHDPRYLVAKPVEAVLDDTAIGDEDVAATVSASLWSTLDARGAFVVVAPPTSARESRGVRGWARGAWTSARSSTARARSRGTLRVRRARERVALSNDEKENEETKEPPETAHERRVVVVRGGEEPEDLRARSAPGPTSRRRGRGRARRRRASRRTTRTSRCTSRVHRVRGRARGDGIRERRGQKGRARILREWRKRASRPKRKISKSFERRRATTATTTTTTN